MPTPFARRKGGPERTPPHGRARPRTRPKLRPAANIHGTEQGDRAKRWLGLSQAVAVGVAVELRELLLALDLDALNPGVHGAAMSRVSCGSDLVCSFSHRFVCEPGRASPELGESAVWCKELPASPATRDDHDPLLSEGLRLGDPLVDVVLHREPLWHRRPSVTPRYRSYAHAGEPVFAHVSTGCPSGRPRRHLPAAKPLAGSP